MTFSYLEISSITIPSVTQVHTLFIHSHSSTSASGGLFYRSISCSPVLQVVLETDRHILPFSVMDVEDLEAMVNHVTTSLRRIVPDSCPG